MKTLRMLLAWLALCWAPLTLAVDYPEVMNQVISRGDALTQAYQPAEAVRFGNGYSELYFGGFEGEGLEFAVGQADQDAMVAIELAFSQLIGAAVSGQPRDKVQVLWEKLRTKLVAAPMIATSDASFTELLVQSLLILLREGVEALLVIAALLAYLRKAGAGDKTIYIWMGAAAALVASALTAWGLQSLLSSSGATREVIEGVSLLVAAVLLSYVSAWLFARRELQQWQSFIQHKMGQALDTNKLFSIVAVAFFAVYREGAETILFYQALISGAEGQWEPLLLGFALAAMLLVGVYVVIFMLSVRLPLALFFSATAVLLYLLSVVFAGKAALELQISGWLPSTSLDGFPTVGWLGIFPTQEALLLQACFVVLPVVAFYLFAKPTGMPKVAA